MPSKLARTLGDAAPAPIGKPSRADAARGSMADLLQGLLAEQVAQLDEQDAHLRTGNPRSVHKLRIAARRLRSTLTTYRSLLDPSVVDRCGSSCAGWDARSAKRGMRRCCATI